MYPAYKELLVGIKESPNHIILYQIANEQWLKIGDFESKIFTEQNLKGAQILLRTKFKAINGILLFKF